MNIAILHLMNLQREGTSPNFVKEIAPVGVCV